LLEGIFEEEEENLGDASLESMINETSLEDIFDMLQGNSTSRESSPGT